MLTERCLGICRVPRTFFFPFVKPNLNPIALTRVKHRGFLSLLVSVWQDFFITSSLGCLLKTLIHLFRLNNFYLLVIFLRYCGFMRNKAAKTVQEGILERARLKAFKSQTSMGLILLLTISYVLGSKPIRAFFELKLMPPLRFLGTRVKK